MKKLLITLLLLIFCTVQGTWAGEVIIIGSDGQARYEDGGKYGGKYETVSSDVIQNVKKKDILNEVIITDDMGKRESIYIDYKGKVKHVEEGQISQPVQVTVDKTKEAEHQKAIKNAPKVIMNYESILSQYGYGKSDKSSKSKKEYIKMNLLDGDYAIVYKELPYIAEYHKDGILMGLAKIEKNILNEEKANVIFYEYRLGYNTTSGMGLKHILFLDYEKDKYISQYIYNVDGKLLCRQINNDIYVASEARNMIPDWRNKTDVKLIIRDNKRKHKKNIFGDIAGTILFPILGPVAFWVLFVDLVFLADN